MSLSDPLLERIDAYCDAVPRARARTEQHGDIILFIRDGAGWPFYARPAPGRRVPSDHAVVEVRERQRSLGIPETFEWIEDVTPGMLKVVRRAGLTVHEHPLMVLPPETPARPPSVPAPIEIRLVGADEDLATIGAVPMVAFANPGTAIGEAGPEQLASVAAGTDPDVVELQREHIRAGQTIVVGAFHGGVPVGYGVHQPVGSVTELAGVGTLPSYRRRGIGAAITGLLVADARRRGIEVLFLTAGDEEIARVYASQGFTRVGTSGTAEAPAA